MDKLNSKFPQGKHMKTLNLDLEKYAKEGGRAKIKTVKNRQYIVLRLRGKDKSLGPYGEELWQKCIQLGMVKEEPENIEALKRTVEKLSLQLNTVSSILKAKIELLEKMQKKNENLQKKTAKDHHDVLSYLIKRVNKLEDNYTLGNMRDNFTCSKCGSKKLVAVNTKCTKCNLECWHGWYTE